MSKLTGNRLKAPCWWCSKALRGGYGQIILVDGNEVAIHAQCKTLALEDEDFTGRIKSTKKLFDNL